MEVLLGMVIAGLIQYVLARIEERKQDKKILMEKELAELKYLNEKTARKEQQERQDSRKARNF